MVLIEELSVRLILNQHGSQSCVWCKSRTSNDPGAVKEDLLRFLGFFLSHIVLYIILCM